jgi:hypothetical protein
MRPDDICAAYAKQKGMKKITLNITKEGDMVYFEGTPEALEFIGNLFIAQARYDKDCSFFLSPQNPGGMFFNKRKSTHGLYIQR